MVRPTKRIVRNPELEPEQEAAPPRSFSKGRLMQVHLPATDDDAPGDDPSEVVPPAAANVPQTSKFDARASGGGGGSGATSPADDEAGVPVYSVRGREVVDLREEAEREEAEREAAEAVAVDLRGQETVELHRSETYYQRHSAHLPHLSDQDFDRPSPAKGHAKK